MKYVLLFLLLLAPVARATDDTPPISVELNAECSEGASTLGFLVRDKFRESKAFKLAETGDRLHLHMQATSDKNLIIVSAVWTYQRADSTVEYYVTQGLTTVGVSNMKDQMPDMILANTEAAWRHFSGKK